MAFPTYGKLLLDSYAEQPQPAVERTEMESGPAKQRRKQSRRLVQRPYSVIFTSAEYASFKSWHVNTVSHGADWDTWTDPVDGVSKQARIVNGDYSAQALSAGTGAVLEYQVDLLLETWE